MNYNDKGTLTYKDLLPGDLIFDFVLPEEIRIVLSVLEKGGLVHVELYKPVLNEKYVVVKYRYDHVWTSQIVRL